MMMNDTLRRAANLILAPIMWGVSTLPQITDWGRTASEFSNQNDSLLVPFGAAFSIWLPIFILCIVYGVTQARPSQKENPVFRAAGPWTAIGFLCVSLWALLSAHAPEDWVLPATALIFIPIVFCLVKAMLIMVSKKGLTTQTATEMNTHFAPSGLSTLGISLIAGWTCLALFLNWTPLIGNLTGLNEVWLCVIILLCALIVIATLLKKSGGVIAYAFSAIWGLSFLALERFQTKIAFESIGILAIVGALALALYTAYLNGRFHKR